LAQKRRKRTKIEPAGPTYKSDLPTIKRSSSFEEGSSPQNPMNEWPVQEAKARFSELLETAEKGPQLITKRGLKKAVLVSFDEWERMTSPRKRNIIEILTAPEPRIDDLQIPDRKTYRWRKIPKF
jgi:antitoxin Phd